MGHRMGVWLTGLVVAGSIGSSIYFASDRSAVLAATTSDSGKVGRNDPYSPRTPEDAVTPAIRWQSRHDQFVERARQGNIGVLFLGDSITDNWPTLGKESWDQLAPYKAVNFGIGGDRTEHVLWRIENGELDGIKPKVVAVMIGTNNIGDGNHADEKPEWAAAGVAKIVKTIREKLPEAKVLLLAIFPRNGKDSELRRKAMEVNKIISKLDDGKSVKYLDIGHLFLDDKGEIPIEIMPDSLHPNARGYQIWLDAIRPTLDEMMKDQPAIATQPIPQTAEVPKLRTAESAVTPTPDAPDRHKGFVAQASGGNIDLLFLGDSITDFWTTTGADTWKKLESYRPADFGISGEQTEHILWRITNGELDGMNPKVVAIMIGTNNVGHFPGEKPEWAAAGIAKIVQTVRAKLPRARVLLFGVFPRDARDSELRHKVETINQIISKLDDGNAVRYLDIGSVFLDEKGEIPKEIMPDALHPNARGYQLWFDAMRRTLDEMMKK